MPNLRIVEKTPGGNNNIVVLRIEGSIDQANLGMLQKTIGRVVAGGCSKLVAQCEKLTFISSSGIGVFIDLKEILAEKKGELVFAAVPAKFLNIFHKVGIDELFTLCTGENEAVARLTQAG